MRIISGLAGGHSLKVPSLVTRPTTDRVREAIFSMLGGSWEGLRVLDLFAGSGALGLEALSRGAGEAHFVEHHGGACAVIQDNLTRARLEGGKVIKADVFSTLRRLASLGVPFDVIFADPPYAKTPRDPDYTLQLLDNPDLRTLLASGGTLMLECMVSRQECTALANWSIVRDRRYGDTRILILQPALPDGAISPALLP